MSLALCLMNERTDGRRADSGGGAAAGGRAAALRQNSSQSVEEADAIRAVILPPSLCLPPVLSSRPPFGLASASAGCPPGNNKVLL